MHRPHRHADSQNIGHTTYLAYKKILLAQSLELRDVLQLHRGTQVWAFTSSSSTTAAASTTVVVVVVAMATLPLVASLVAPSHHTRTGAASNTARTAAGERSRQSNENQVQVREERSDASSEMSTSIRKRFALEFAVGNSQQTTQHTKHTGFLRNVGNCRTLDTARIPPYKATHIRQTQRAGNRRSHSLRGSSPLNASRIGGRGASRCDRVVSTSTHGRQLAAGQRRDDGCAKHSLDRR